MLKTFQSGILWSAFNQSCCKSPRDKLFTINKGAPLGCVFSPLFIWVSKIFHQRRVWTVPLYETLALMKQQYSHTQSLPQRKSHLQLEAPDPLIHMAPSLPALRGKSGGSGKNNYPPPPPGWLYYPFLCFNCTALQPPFDEYFGTIPQTTFKSGGGGERVCACLLVRLLFEEDTRSNTPYKHVCSIVLSI